MINLRRILVPTDFSEFSEQALRYAYELAGKFESELHLLLVVDDSTPLMLDPEFIQVDDFRAQQVSAAQKRLDECSVDSSNHKLSVARELRQGNPFVEIVRYAKDKDIDLIVMGTHGRSGLVHMMMGSVAEKVVRKARCPVLTIPKSEHEFVMP